MRVLFITNCPAPYRVKFFNELSRHCDLTVAYELEKARNRDREWKSEEDSRFREVFLESRFRKEEGALCPGIKKYLEKFKNDTIVVGGYSTPTGMYGILYMRIHHIPFVLNSDGGMVKNDSALKARIKRFFIGGASAWLSTGAACTRYLEHYGADRGRIYEYPFTSVGERDLAAADAGEKEELRRKLGIGEEKMVLFVGQFIERKGLDLLLKACWDMEDTALVLVGGTDAAPFLPETDSAPRVHIYVKGFQPESGTRQYYRAADVFVLPTREDIWGLVVNEAMAAGLPVVTTDRCGAGLELVEDGVNGYLVPSGDAKRLRERIESVLNDAELRKNICRAYVEKMRGYTVEAMAERHMEAFQKMKNDSVL